MVGNTLTISLAQVGFNCTRQQRRHWSPLSCTSGQGVTERWALVAWVGAPWAREGSYTPSLITKPCNQLHDVVIWTECDQLPQSSWGCSSCQSKVAYQRTATSGGVDIHDFVSGVVTQALVPVAR